MDIEKAIKELNDLIDNGTTMKEIAEKSGIYYQTIRQISRGETNMQLSTYRKLTKYLDAVS